MKDSYRQSLCPEEWELDIGEKPIGFWKSY